MSDPIDRLVQELSFPRAGELFAVVLNPHERIVSAGSFGSETIVKQQDRSYFDVVFRCLASDASRVVGISVYGGWSKDARIFMRHECRFDDVSLIAPALGLTEKPADSE